jgi:hypothetical protein
MQQWNRSGQPQCDFADRVERVVNVLISRISGHMPASQWEACQITLWSFYQELLAELREKGRFHYSSPAGSPHRCAPQVYEDGKTVLYLMQQSPPPPAPAPPPKPRSLAEVLKYFREEGDDTGNASGTTS